MGNLSIRRLLVGLTPPVLAAPLRAIYRRVNPPPAVLQYLPAGWDDGLLSVPSSGWDVESVVTATCADNLRSLRQLQAGGALGAGHQHNLHVSFAYVVVRAARLKSSLSILDWGSGLGYYCHIARAALPDVPMEYHCKETATLAAAGRRTVLEAVWHDDETCLKQRYNLVMLSGSLQYARDWKGQLRSVVSAAAEWLYITRLPVVDSVPGFVALQRVYGSTMLHWQFNRGELLDFVGTLGFVVEREFETGDRPYIKDAPEQCELRGWLFRRAEIR